ncbi:MAG TPA: serine hydrolase domain-containing protein [Pyrinomonadaceae bacterium]|nr:serine hydrolase domain-containing protein [Pyrinomonadaceae bacterium]
MTRITRRRFGARTLAAAFAALATPRLSSLLAAPKQGKTDAKRPRNLTEDFLARLPRVMELAYVPGISVAVVEGGQVVWSRGFGVRSAETKEPVDAETIFPAASLSKPVFAYAVLRMRDEGLIDLDRPLAGYLPDAYTLEDPRSKLITARHVLSHSTGLQNWRFAKDDKLQIAFDPGERFGYSGEGYYYLQRVVEKISGQPFAAYMRERVLVPLGMASSSYVWLPEYERRGVFTHRNRGQAVESFFARGGRKMHEVAAKWRKPAVEWRHEDAARAMPEIDPNWNGHPVGIQPNAAGSLHTTAAEYARFMLRVMERPRPDSLDLKDSTRREMLVPRVRINSALAWGLGWGLESEQGRQYFWHWGDGLTYHSFAIGDAARSSGLVVLTNSNFGPKVYQRVINQATGHDHPAFLWV